MADTRRRKSLSLFKHRQDGVLQEPVPALPTSPIQRMTTVDGVDFEKSSPTHPKPIQKTSRTSKFGSLRSTHALDDGEKLTKTESTASSFFEDDAINVKELSGDTVLHFGEVQSTGAMFRKRTTYLVLTESYLIRFKSQAKAAEVFPTLPMPLKRAPTIRGSTTSLGSFQDLQLATSVDITSGVRLDQVVAIYKLDDGRPYFTIEVSYLDEAASRASSLQMSLSDPREAELWLTAIHSAARNARMRRTESFLPRTIDYLVSYVDRQLDYDPAHFRAFKVIQRAVVRSAGRTSNEDLSRLNSLVCYLAVGLNKIHLLPLARTSARSSSASLAELDNSLAFGIVTLMSVSLQRGEDTLQLVFNEPLRGPFVVHLASSEASEVVLFLRSATEYLRPEWVRQPIIMNVPSNLEDQVPTGQWPVEDHKCFDRTLMAYCAAFLVNASRICYTIDYDCEDAPAFRLLPTHTQPYSALELLAVFRALRYNESFATISFSHVNLCSLRLLYDYHDSDPDSLCTRSGTLIHVDGHKDLPVLLCEIRALACKSKRLRRFDFTQCFPYVSQPEAAPPSCGVPEALVPLCKRSLTNVDWIVLNGVRLAESDIDYLVDAASERRCHLRALELGDCGLSVHDADVLLSTLATNHESTMEVLDISGAQGRFSPELFQQQIGAFGNIRRLNLSRVQKSAGSEPLIAPETLLNWRLEALYLSQTAMNEQAVDSISAYLASPKSSGLRELHLNQCALTGADLAVFFQCMARDSSRCREMHVSVNENMLKIGCSELLQAIACNYGPSHLTMRMMDFEKEHQFRELVEALTRNISLQRLDISRASLPYDASQDTCEALRNMFAENSSLQELDISGEHAHLDTARFGIGLNLALRGLKTNTTLKVLRIEHQALGLQGADTLAELLEENRSLVEIHCDNNEINLQSFTVLVNALKNNRTLCYLPDFRADREKSLEKFRREFQGADKSVSPAKAYTLRKSFTGGLAHKGPRLHLRHSSTSGPGIPCSDQDIATAVDAVDRKWNAQISRMRGYLIRNYNAANGLPWEENDEPEEDTPPGSTESLMAALDKVQLDSLSSPGSGSLDYLDEKMSDRQRLVAFTLPED